MPQPWQPRLNAQSLLIQEIPDSTNLSSGSHMYMVVYLHTHNTSYNTLHKHQKQNQKPKKKDHREEVNYWFQECSLPNPIRHLHQTFPSEFRENRWKGWVSGAGGHQENRVFHTHRADAHMNSRDYGSTAWGMDRFKADGVPALSWESAHKLPPLIQKPPSIYNTCKKKLVLSNDSHWGY